MALSRAVRSVLFHDGPFDEADRFLLRSPATDYIENLYFHKQGSLNKRAGSQQRVDFSNASGDALLLHPIGKNLHALSTAGAHSYDGTGVRDELATGFVGTKEMILETPPLGGMGHVDMAIVREDQSSPLSRIRFYVVVYEVRETSTRTTGGLSQPELGPKHVVIQSYSSDGTFLYQKRIDNARSPKIHLTGTPNDNNVDVWYYDDNADSLKVTRYSAFSGTLQSTLDTGLTVARIYALLGHAVTGVDLTLGVRGMVQTRLGATDDGHARYFVTYSSFLERYAVVYVNDNWDTWVAGFTKDLVLIDQSLLYSGGRAEDSAFSAEPFDIEFASVTGGNCVVLWAESANVSGQRSRVYLTGFNVDIGAVSKLADRVLLESTADNQAAPNKRDWAPKFWTHGAIAPRGLKTFWSVCRSGIQTGLLGTSGVAGLNMYARSNRYWSQGIEYGVVDNGLADLVPRKYLPSHRLAFKPLWRNNDELYLGVQQQIDHSVKLRQAVTTADERVAVDGALVPRTTVVLALGDGSETPRPVGYVDAGISKVTEYGESEFNRHIPRGAVSWNAPKLNYDLVFPNRITLRAEDLSVNSQGSGEDNDYKHTGAAESPADATIRVHRIVQGSIEGRQLTATSFGDGVLVGTAVPLWFDGRHFGELSPLDQPEIVAVEDAEYLSQSQNDNFVAQHYAVEHGTPDRWLRLQVVVGYFDAKGNKHRSAPSTPLYVFGINPVETPRTNAGGTSIPASWGGEKVTIYVTTPLSVVPADVDYFVEVYAGAADTDPQLVDVGRIVVGAQSTQRIEVTLTRSKGTSVGDNRDFWWPIRTSETLYTAQGELPADPWPAFDRAVVTSTRLFALDAVNKGKVLVSKRFADFIAPEYNATLDINLGDERDLLCIAKLDDKTVVFERDDIHVIYGDGPLNNGAGEDFTVQYISTDVGCEDQESIVECPAGLVFYRKERGFYLLDRNLQLTYIGEKVHNLTKGIDVVSGQLVSSEGHVRFLCRVVGEQQTEYGDDPDPSQTRPPRPVYGNRPPSSDFALVWDYEKNQWSVFSSYPGEAATVWEGQYTRLQSDFTVWQERANTDTDFTDPSGQSRTLIRTGWIPLADNTQGYSRLYRMSVLGRYLSTLREVSPGVYDACDIQVRVWYDYEEGPDVVPQTKLFRFQDFGFNPFSKRNIRAERLQFAVMPPEGRGRCQAVKLEFEEVKPQDDIVTGATYELGQGFEISSVDFEIGIDPRVMRQLPRAVVK